MVTLKVRIFALLSLSFICVSFLQKEKTKLDLSTEEELVNSIQYYRDSTNLFLEFGRDFEYDFSSNCMRTATGSTLSQRSSYNYLDLGIGFIYTKTTMGEPNDDFSEFDVVNESESLRIEIESRSKIPVYGLVSTESNFDDLNELKLNGKWCEFIEKNGEKHYFSFVTKYVNFNTDYISSELIDSLSLDFENRELMDSYFNNKKIKNFTIRDSESFYKRIME